MSLEDAWSRIQNTVREVEKELRSSGTTPPAAPVPGAFRVHVKIDGEKVAMTTTTSTTGTETTTTTSSTSSTSSTSATPSAQVYCYPGIRLYRDLRYIDTGWEWFESDELVWVQELNDNDLIVGKRYEGQAVEYYDGRALIVVTLGGGGTGDTKMLRFQGPFVVDDPARLPAPSPWCFYPAFDQKFTSAGKSDLVAYWVIFWYGITPVPGSPDPTTVKVDGTAAHLCIDAGFDYAPTGYDSRRVYVCDSFAAAFEGGCRVVDGFAGFGVDLEG